MWTNTWSGRIGLITHRNRFRKISGHLDGRLRAEPFEVGVEEILEFRAGFVGQENVASEEAVAARVLRGASLAFGGDGASGPGSVGAGDFGSGAFGLGGFGHGDSRGE